MASSIPKLADLHKLVRNNDLERATLCIYGEIDKAIGKGKSNKDLNIRDYRGMTPLHVAVSLVNLEFTKFLVEAGANINARDKVNNLF